MDAFDREIAALVDELKSPKQRSAMLARFARDEIAASKRHNERAIGRTIKAPAITVDGHTGAPLTTVKPDGTVVAVFNVETVALRWILRELEQVSPQLTGAYRNSHTVFADGVEMLLRSVDETPEAREYVVASDLPYARKLDPDNDLPARSRQAPRGVYAAISAVAAKRFGDEAMIHFTFRDIPLKGGGVSRNPAIVVRPL